MDGPANMQHSKTLTQNPSNNKPAGIQLRNDKSIAHISYWWVHELQWNVLDKIKGHKTQVHANDIVSTFFPFWNSSVASCARVLDDFLHKGHFWVLELGLYKCCQMRSKIYT